MSNITDAHAKATEAAALAIKEGIQTVRGLGAYFERIFGTVPEDLVGYFGGDRLKVMRAENIVRIMKRAQELNEERNVQPEPVSISVGLPLLIAAADESREELVDLWARLLAAASDPARSKKFRAAFVEVAKKMDPLDAVLLKALHVRGNDLHNLHRQDEAGRAMRADLKITDDEMRASMSNLQRLDLLSTNSILAYPGVTPFGREFLRAVGEID